MVKKTLNLLSLVALSFGSTTVYAMHPLFTDDTGTQGKGNSQLEAVHERAKDEDQGIVRKENVTAFTLTHGVADTVDAFVGVPHIAYDYDNGLVKESGMGDSQVGIKWRFHEQGPLSFALKPTLSISTGDENKDLGTGKNGYSVFAIGTYAVESWTFNAQVGRIHAPDVWGSPANSTAVSVNAIYEISGKAKLALDYGRITNPDPAATEDDSFAIVGAVFPVNKDLDLDIGYRKGINDAEIDTTIMLGLTSRF